MKSIKKKWNYVYRCYILYYFRSFYVFTWANFRSLSMLDRQKYLNTFVSILKQNAFFLPSDIHLDSRAGVVLELTSLAIGLRVHGRTLRSNKDVIFNYPTDVAPIFKMAEKRRWSAEDYGKGRSAQFPSTGRIHAKIRLNSLTWL